jgi:hypothetical protein
VYYHPVFLNITRVTLVLGNSYLRNAYGDTVTKRTQNSISDSRGPARTCCDARHMVRVESYGGQQESAQPPHEVYKFSPEQPTDYRTDKDLGLDW